jgi:hypothetical protein
MKDMLKSNSVLKDLDISDSSSRHGTYGAVALAKGVAEGLRDNGALTSLDMSSNNLGGVILAPGWKSQQKGSRTLYYQEGAKTGQFNSPPGCGPLGIIALANAIPDMGAISSVNLLKNKIGIDQADALVSMLNEHPTLKSLCGNTGNETELDMSGKMNGPEDAIMLVAEIAGNGAILSVNLLQNKTGIDQAKILASILKEHATLKSLCGNTGDETELNMRDKKMGAGDAIMLAAEIVDNGALTSLNLASNDIGGYKDKTYPYTFHATPDGNTFVLSLHHCSYSLLK